jgi:hypothetical protein
MASFASRSTAVPGVVRRKSRQASRVANGSALLPGGVNGIDGRSVWIRRLKEIISDAISDLGGEDNTSSAERSIIRRCAVLTIALEGLELKFAKAGDATPRDLDLYQRTAGNLRRLLESLGLKRRPRDADVTLADHIARNYRRPEAAE